MEDRAQFESNLWEAADNLRANSKLTSSDYFMPVLGVIFLRHAASIAADLAAVEAVAEFYNRRSHAVIWKPADNLIVSTGFAVITPKAVPPTFAYFATTTDAFVGYLANHARGAAYPAVAASDFERAEILVPAKRLLTAFDGIVEPTFSVVHNLHQQNKQLRAARDLLLPRLMSGEIPG